jgi:uncharacterized protein involved in copper resistance
LLAKAGSNVKSTANKALKKAKEAQKTATAAQAAATSAGTEAKGAETDANKAQTEAKKGVTNAAAAQTTANSANNTATSAKALATEAKAAAAAAEANANTRIKSSTEVVGEPSASNNTEATKFASVACPSGDITLGGGYFVGGTEAGKVTVYESVEGLYGNGWFAAGSAINSLTPTWKITAIATCGTK